MYLQRVARRKWTVGLKGKVATLFHLSDLVSVQNPLTTLFEAVASAERVLNRQEDPTVLAGHSFSGMIVTQAGVHPNVSAVVYVAARAPDANEDYSALAKTFATPPAWRTLSLMVVRVA